MATDSRIQAFFKDAEKSLSLKFRGWEGDIPHEGEKGGVRQRRVADLLSDVLPKRYGIGTGHIVASRGEIVVSPQIDIVIFDALEGIELRIDDHYSLFPCESVYATIEVKSELNASDGNDGPGGTIFECVANATAVKALDRSKHALPPVHSLVFAYTTRWSRNQAERVMQWFETFGTKYSMKLPESVFVLEPSFVLRTGGPTGYNDRGEFNILFETDPLLYFVSDLIHRLSQMRAARPHLWEEYVTWGKSVVITKIYQQERSADDEGT